MHLLTDRLADAYPDLSGGPRRTGIRLRRDHAMLVGVPEAAAVRAFEAMVNRVQR